MEADFTKLVGYIGVLCANVSCILYLREGMKESFVQKCMWGIPMFTIDPALQLCQQSR